MNANSTPKTVPQTVPGKKLISLVLPVFNEEQTLPILAARIAKSMWGTSFDHEILFVNDGSQDGSGQILDELASTCRRIRVVHLSRNFGYQAAVHAGLAHARGDAVVLMNSDLQDAPEEILKMVSSWQDGYEVVYALRKKRKEKGWKRLFRRLFDRMAAGVTSVSVPVEAGNFGLIDRRVAKWILTLGEHDRSFTDLRSWVGFKQIGVEIERNHRQQLSTARVLRKQFRRAMTQWFSFSNFPLKAFHGIGLASLGLFAGVGTLTLLNTLITGWVLPGWTSFLLMGSFFGALNALGISLLGEYLVRIYDQVRNRPLYLVDRTVNMEIRESGKKDTATNAMVPAFDDDSSGDRPYLNLMEEATGLLQVANTMRDTFLPIDIASCETSSYVEMNS